MKKNYFLISIFTLFSFLTYAQGPWNFNGSNDIWESTGTSANLTSGASFSTLDVNGAGNPMLRTFSANINASAVTHAVITLKNNTANKHMRVFYQTTGTNRYVNVAITANDADFVTYYVDMTGNADWTGTVNDLTFQFRENSSYNSALDGTIDIDNIEMTSSDLGVNMVNNSSFENWNDDTEATPVDPVGFYKHESVERSSDSHSGDYSIKVIATSTRDLAQTVNEITAGATYRVSINYKLEANTGNGVRLWSTWKDASSTNLASLDLQPSGYLNTVSSEWATFSVDAVAPENATKMNFEVRAYNGATVYWDSFSVSKVQEPVQPLLITTSVCSTATSVRLTGPWWGWDPAGGPEAADNGDGTWTFTFDPAPTDNMEYLLVVNGVQENLISIMANGGDCAPVTDNASYANRRWDLGTGDVTNTYGQCGSTCVAPVITLTGTDVTINNGDTYTDQGATASDDEEGDITANIVVGGDTVDTSTDGTYTITYDVSDGAGNAATTVSRVVTVETPAYCDSEPTINDGSGVSSVAFNGTDFTSGGDITYEDFTATAVEAGQSTTASLNITFATSYTYDTHVWVDLNDDYSFDSSELLYSGESMSTNPTTLDASFLVPSDAPLGDHRVRIGTADSGQSTPNPCYNGSYGVTIDMTITVVEPPSCLAPSALTAANITFSSADISWVSDGTSFNIEYGPEGFTPGSGTTDTSTTTSYSLSGLSSNTTYDVYVQNDCGSNGTSEMVLVTLTSNAACGDTVTYCYDNGLNSVFSATVDNVGDYITVSIIEGDTESCCDDLIIYDSSDDSGNELYRGAGDLTGVSITSTTGIISVWVDADGSVSCLDPSSWSGLPSTSLVMDVTCAPPPTCIDPSDLTVASITTTSADISWTSDDSSFNVEVVDVTAGGTATGTATYTGVTSPYSLSGLDSNTEYEVYVQTDCGSGDTSAWAGPVSFTTEPAPIVPDYTNDFSSYPGEFWTEGTGALATGPSGTSSAWSADGFANSGTTGAAKVNVYYSSFGGNDDWLISPMFDLSSGPYYLNLNVALTAWNSTASSSFGSSDFVSLMLTEDNGSTWVELHRWDTNDTPSATGSAMPEIDLSSYNSMTKFAFYAESAIGNIDNDFFIDDFQITTTSLGVDDNQISLFNYFPNPVKDVLTIKAQNNVEDVKVFNMLGQMVLRQNPYSRDCIVDLSTMQTGAYFVQVSIGNTVETVRILKN